MDEQVKAIQNLVAAALQGNLQAQAQIQQILQTAQIIQDTMKQALGGQPAAQEGSVLARNGAKLNYIKQLRGQCPDGYELTMFRQGGHICKKCMKKLKMQEGGDLDPVESFKCGRRLKKKEVGGQMAPPRKKLPQKPTLPYEPENPFKRNKPDTLKDPRK